MKHSNAGLKKGFWLFQILLLGAAFSAGVILQKNHIPHLLKRTFQGYPLHVPPPQRTILDWDLKRTAAIEPRFSLRGLPVKELEANRPVYQEQIKNLLRLPAFPRDFSARIKILERVELPGVYREKITLETEPGLWIPFYLFIPKNQAGRSPLILVIHGHSAGKIETAGLVDSYQQRNALELAKADFVTLAPDLRGFGELGWSGDWEDPSGHQYGKGIHIQDALYNLQTGRTLLGSFIYDLQKILDYAVQRKEVDAARIGVAGTSLGADTAVWLAALDERIRAVAASYPALPGYPYPGVYGSSHLCASDIPDVRLFFRLEEIPFLIFPRPFLTDFNPRHPAFNPSGLESLYKQAGSPEKISATARRTPETFDHVKAAAWFRKWL